MREIQLKPISDLEFRFLILSNAKYKDFARDEMELFEKLKLIDIEKEHVLVYDLVNRTRSEAYYD